MLLNIVDWIFFCYMMMLFIRILSAWVPEFQHYTFFRFVAFYTDPYLNFFRQFVPALGMIDISPIIAFICLYLIEEVVKGMVVTFFG